MRAVAVQDGQKDGPLPFDLIVLDAQARNVRRKLLTCQNGDEVLVDLPRPVMLRHGDCLVLEDGRLVEVIAAEESLLELTARDGEHLLRLAWHIGNRHLQAQIETGRILIQRDRVIADMLRGLGAEVREVCEPFHPEHGAYHSHGH
jgi:urease accessory protein